MPYVFSKTHYAEVSAVLASEGHFALELIEAPKQKPLVRWKCRLGHELNSRLEVLRKGCRCRECYRVSSDRPRPPPKTLEVGQKFGDLEVLEYLGMVDGHSTARIVDRSNDIEATIAVARWGRFKNLTAYKTWEQLYTALHKIGAKPLFETGLTGPIGGKFLPRGLSFKCKCTRRFSPSVYRILSGQVTTCGCDNTWQPRTWGVIRNIIEGNGFKAKFDWPDAEATTVEVRVPEFSDLECKCGRTYGSLGENWSNLTTRDVKSCGCVRSHAQIELATFIEGLGEAVETNCRTVLGGLEIDVWVPGKRLGFEYSGLHWHGEKLGGKRARKSCLRKHLLAEAAEARLVTIFEDEWLTRRPAVEARIRAILGKSDKSVGARSCEIAEDSAGAKVLCADYHLQGPAGGRGWVLRSREGENLAAMVFAKPNASRARKSIPGTWELTRYVVKAGWSIPGGFSRLLQAFLRTENQCREIVSYSDRRWSAGDVYGRAGFEKHAVNPPSYWYFTKKAVRQHRFGLRKSVLVARGGNPSFTEWEMAQVEGYDRIWDAGSVRWVYTTPSNIQKQETA